MTSDDRQKLKTLYSRLKALTKSSIGAGRNAWHDSEQSLRAVRREIVQIEEANRVYVPPINTKTYTPTRLMAVERTLHKIRGHFGGK